MAEGNVGKGPWKERLTRHSSKFFCRSLSCPRFLKIISILFTVKIVWEGEKDGIRGL